jgi:ubiquinone/menaquinone biosynthesis C-methylase UbiE
MKIAGSKDTIDWYDANAEKYANDSDGITFEDTASHFLGNLKLKPKVLDVGCGSGRDTETLHNLGADVTGLDISKGLLEVAKKKRPGIMFVEGSFLDIPFPDQTFDGIWSHASLVHLDTTEDVRRALNEFNRVLKLGGYLYILVKKQFGKEKTAIVSDTLSNHDRFFRYYTEEELTSLLQETGFAVTEVVTEDDVHGRVEVKWIKIFAKK